MTLSALYSRRTNIAFFMRGYLLVVAMCLVIASEALSLPVLRTLAGGCGALFLLMVIPHVKWSRQIFVLVGVLVSVYALVMRDDGIVLVENALASGGYILGFFVALSSLRTAASSSDAIQRCGEFLSTRTPGKRYLALTLGGHLFSLVLNYGSITLLGALVEKADGGIDGKHKNPVRVRRMLLAIQRGFITTLCWSPLTFAMVVGPSVIPGSSWKGVIWYGLGSALVLITVGWVVDALHKPASAQVKLSRPVATGNPRALMPLLILLVIIFSSVAFVHEVAGLSIVTVVMIIIPILSMSWIALQAHLDEGRDDTVVTIVRRRCSRYVGQELDSYKSEMVLLFIAGYVGKIGGALAAPLVTSHIIDFSVVPTWAILSGIIIILPVLGQIGLHPILAVSLMGPMLPDASVMGVSPNIVLAAVCLGWAFGGATSPFTATVILVAMFGKVKASAVGWDWNRVFVLLGIPVCIAWIIALSAWVM